MSLNLKPLGDRLLVEPIALFDSIRPLIIDPQRYTPPPKDGSSLLEEIAVLFLI